MSRQQGASLEAGMANDSARNESQHSGCNKSSEGEKEPSAYQQMKGDNPYSHPNYSAMSSSPSPSPPREISSEPIPLSYLDGSFFTDLSESQPQFSPPPLDPPKKKSSTVETWPSLGNSSNVIDKIDAMEEEPYTIKCICNFTDDDGNTIFCETCETWQHINCFYPDNREEVSREDFAHSCAECNPRQLDRQRAAERVLQLLNPAVEEPSEKKTKRPPSKSQKKQWKPNKAQTYGHSASSNHPNSSTVETWPALGNSSTNHPHRTLRVMNIRAVSESGGMHLGSNKNTDPRQMRYRCDYDQCSRSRLGFTSNRDLLGHKWIAHGDGTETFRYVCNHGDCAKEYPPKIWRKANIFLTHLKSVHQIPETETELVSYIHKRQVPRMRKRIKIHDTISEQPGHGFLDLSDKLDTPRTRCTTDNNINGEEDDMENSREPAEVGTDSGYGSLGAIRNDKGTNTNTLPESQNLIATDLNDNMTEYSVTSSLATWKEETYVEELVGDLVKKVQELQPDEDTLEKISVTLPDLLKAFALRVGYNAPSQMHRDVMYFIHRHRNVIASSFREKSLNQDPEVDRRPPDSTDQMPLKDLMSSWFSRLTGVEIKRDTEFPDTIPNETPVDPASPMSGFQASEADNEGDNEAWIGNYRQLINNSEVFKWLIGSLYVESSLVTPEPKAMDAIREKVFSELRPSQRLSRYVSSESFSATFHVAWDPLKFFKDQEYKAKGSDVISQVITLTGSERDAQALTCAQYLSQTWPSTGVLTLRLIEDVLRDDPKDIKTCNYPDGTRISAWMQDEAFFVEVCGVRDSIAEVAEQIGWLTASLRTSWRRDGLLCCIPFIAKVRRPASFSQDRHPTPVRNLLFELEFNTQEITQQLNPQNGQCWHHMFLNPVLVKGYPIPRKVKPDSGLEIPLDIMAGLARTKIVDEFKEKTFIKGFSTLLVPTKRVKDTILWHMVYQKDGGRISYLDHNLPHTESVSPLELTNSRHVLGWCVEARFFPGSSECNYSVGDSTLPRPHQGCALFGLYVSPGRCIVGNVSYSLGKKDTPVHVTRNGYIPKLQWLSTKLVLLWDEEEKRGWLINGNSALLHLVRASLDYNSRDKFKSAFVFRKADLQESSYPYTADSAIDVLINEENRALKLYKEADHFLLLQSRIDHYYNIMEKLIDHQTDIDGDNGISADTRLRQNLEGWDFSDLARNRDPFHPRLSLLEASGKGWVDFTRAINALTIFGSGFGELIKPERSSNCKYWSELPKQKYYIAACLSDLYGLMEKKYYHNDGQVRLAENIIWHTPSELFGSCQCKGSLGPDHSEPVQALVPSTMAHILLPRSISIPLNGHGAVIFGSHSEFSWIWGDIGGPEYGRVPSLLSKASDADSLTISDIGSSASSTTFKTSFTSISPRSSALGLTSSSSDLKRRVAYFEGSDISSEEREVRDPANYTVGILCALPKELLAVRALFDRNFGKPDVSFGDSNHYSLGQIAKHMVVVAPLPTGEYGTNAAAESASNMKRSFPNIHFCLLVGIGGGAPSDINDIRLGDVVVSSPTKTYPGVIQYDRGKTCENSHFQMTGALQSPPRFLMTAVSSLSSDPDIPPNALEPYLEEILERIPLPKKSLYRHPGQNCDEFFEEACSKCQAQEDCIYKQRHLKQREPRPTDNPEIHYGLIASGNSVMKDARIRDSWVKQHGVMCFEMEAAGVMNTFPCLVIRGICDYADSYKNNRWQEYAAATAAAYAKLLLKEVSLFGGHASSTLAMQGRAFEYNSHENLTKRRRTRIDYDQFLE